jgi:hypothetical protein
MIRQYDERVHLKWMPLVRAPCCPAQRCDLLGQKIASTIEKICSEKPTSARHKRATIVRHAFRLTERPTPGQMAQCASLIAPYEVHPPGQ